MPTTLHDVLVTWRELERELDRLRTDDERAHDIREQIAVLRELYGVMSAAAAFAYDTLAHSHDTLERARDVLRRSAGPREPGVGRTEVVTALRACYSCGHPRAAHRDGQPRPCGVGVSTMGDQDSWYRDPCPCS